MTLPSAKRGPLKTRPGLRPASDYPRHSEPWLPDSGYGSGPIPADKISRQYSENAGAGVVMPKGKVTSHDDSSDAEDLSTKKALDTNGAGSHRQFKPSG